PMAYTLALLILSLLSVWLITTTTVERTHTDELKQNRILCQRTTTWLVLQLPGGPRRIPIAVREWRERAGTGKPTHLARPSHPAPSRSPGADHPAERSNERHQRRQTGRPLSVVPVEPRPVPPGPEAHRGLSSGPEPCRAPPATCH